MKLKQIVQIALDRGADLCEADLREASAGPEVSGWKIVEGRYTKV